MPPAPTPQQLPWTPQQPWSPPTSMGPPAPPPPGLPGYLPGYNATQPAPPTVAPGGDPLLGAYNLATSGAPSGGLDFSALADERGAETNTRIGTLQGFLDLLLADQANVAAGGRAGEAEAGGRDRTFRGDEAERDRATEAAMAATARAFSERQAALSRSLNSRLASSRRDPEDPFALLDAETAAKERLMRLEYELQGGGAAGADPLAEMVAQMGSSEANAYRGDLLRRDGGRRTSVRQSQGPEWQQTVLPALASYIANEGAGDPFSATNFFRERGYGRSADERASLGLADLGYYLR